MVLENCCRVSWKCLNFIFEWKKCSEDAQTQHAGCSKAEPKSFALSQTPFPGAWDGQNLISWWWSLPAPTDPVWWGSMHAISSYRGNRPTDRTDYNTLCRSFASAQCKYSEHPGSVVASDITSNSGPLQKVPYAPPRPGDVLGPNAKISSSSGNGPPWCFGPTALRGSSYAPGNSRSSSNSSGGSSIINSSSTFCRKYFLVSQSVSKWFVDKQNEIADCSQC